MKWRSRGGAACSWAVPFLFRVLNFIGAFMKESWWDEGAKMVLAMCCIGTGAGFLISLLVKVFNP